MSEAGLGACLWLLFYGGKWGVFTDNKLFDFVING